MVPPILDPALDRSERSASHSLPLNPGERTSTAHCIGGQVGSKTGLDAVENKKICCFCCKSNLGRPARNPYMYRLSYPGPILHYALKT
jgi:hypothetical protein